MFRTLWGRLTGTDKATVERREVEREQESPAERRFGEQSIDDLKADNYVGEHFGGVPPERIAREVEEEEL